MTVYEFLYLYKKKKRFRNEINNYHKFNNNIYALPLSIATIKTFANIIFLNVEKMIYRIFKIIQKVILN